MCIMSQKLYSFRDNILGRLESKPSLPFFSVYNAHRASIMPLESFSKTPVQTLLNKIYFRFKGILEPYMVCELYLIIKKCYYV